MRRFYREVTVAVEHDGHQVLLDGRPVRTPARRHLRAPSAELARAIAAEWAGQEEQIRPAAMPLTRMATTALDRMPSQREAAIDQIADYAGTDLLCYRAAEPLELVQRQRERWQPLLDWAAESYRAKLNLTTGLLPVAQPEPALQRLRARVEQLRDWPLIGLHAATTALGSLVLGLALLEDRIDPEAAFTASLLDELFEIERWGEDPESARRHVALRREVEAAATFIAGSRITPAPTLPH